MKKLNIKGFSHLEVLLTILVVVAVAGIGYFGYQRFQASNGSKAAAGSYTFIRNANQMSGSRISYSVINEKTGVRSLLPKVLGVVATLASASEMRSTKTICTHYIITAGTPPRIHLEVKDSRGKVQASASKKLSGGMYRRGNFCLNNKYTGNAGIEAYMSDNGGVAIDTFYGKR
jgi:uncharacterized protein (UPF0333 family)